MLGITKALMKIKSHANQIRIREANKQRIVRIPEVLANIYIGSWKTALKRGSLNKKNITHILNATKYDKPDFFSVCQFHDLSMTIHIELRLLSLPSER